MMECVTSPRNMPFSFLWGVKYLQKSLSKAPVFNLYSAIDLSLFLWTFHFLLFKVDQPLSVSEKNHIDANERRGETTRSTSDSRKYLE
jgi:hypothetical protein